MPRPDPSRSDYCATRHLLRHHANPSELRRNPLARRLAHVPNGDDATRAVWRAVARAFEHMDGDAADRRWRTARHTIILLRMDVAREESASVARDLGISERQLRRERRTAHRRFFSALLRAVPQTVAVLDSSSSVQLQRAERLADSGEPESALAILDDVARKAGDAAVRCRALLRAAGVETEVHRLDVAGRRIDDAQRLLRENGVERDVRPSLEREATVSSLQVAWYVNGPAVVDAASTAPVNGTDARLLLLRACAALRGGDAASARRFAMHIHSTAEFAADPSLRIDVGILEAELSDFLDGNTQAAEDGFMRIATLAGQHGFGGRRLWATHLLAFTRWLHSRASCERNAFRALVDRIDASLPKQQRLMLFFSAADIELAIGSATRAADAARSARRLATNPYERLSADALLAGALLRGGNIAQAEHAAVATAEHARRIGYLRVVSTAQRIAAEAALSLRRRPLARERIEDALACAAGRTSLYVLARTYDVAARITRERRHRTVARELRDAASL